MLISSLHHRSTFPGVGGGSTLPHLVMTKIPCKGVILNPFGPRPQINYAIEIAILRDGLKYLTPVCQPMRSKAESNSNLYARFFPRFEQVSGNCSDYVNI